MNEHEGSVDGCDDALAPLERLLLGARPSLTRLDIAERAGIDPPTARHLWRLLGFAHTDDDTPAFTEADVAALRHTESLVELGVLGEDRADALIRTWARSFARLAEWQATLLADVAVEQGVDPVDGVQALGDVVVPLVEELQSYVWRRHLMNAASRILLGDDAATGVRAVCFVDIVGYTARSKSISDRELVSWLEEFESRALDVVVTHGGRIIKNIGDELLIVTDTADDAAAIASILIGFGTDEHDAFPEVRAGIAYGDVVLRLGDVYGPVVNIAARLTSVARPGTVLVDEGVHAALTGRARGDAGDGTAGDPGADPADDEPGEHTDEADDASGSSYRFRRLRRLSVKGYPRLRAWALRRS